MNVVVLGLWHLGSVTAACCAEHFPTVGMDFDEKTLAALRVGRAAVSEPGLDALLRHGLDRGRLAFASGADAAALGAADVLWLCHDTPLDENDVADVPFVLDQLEACLPALRPGAVVVVSAQLPAGTVHRLEVRHPGMAFACHPENLRLGKALDDFRQPARIIVGVRDRSTRAALELLFAPFCRDILWMRPESAEMTKHGVNAWLALSVTFANELARICEAVGADAREVEQGLRSEPRIGQKAYLRPGAAFSGGTLARDVVALTELAREHGEPTTIFPAILAGNEAHKDWAFRKLQRLLPDLARSTVAVLGLTYKPDTNTLRRSGAVQLCAKLLEAGARVRCYDPSLPELPKKLKGAQNCSSLQDAIADTDAAVIATEWPQIKHADWLDLSRRMRCRLIVDANGFLGLTAAGIEGIGYFTVGSSNPESSPP